MCSISANESISFFSAVSRTGRLLNGSWSKFIGLSLVFFFISWLFFISISAIFNNFIIKDGILWALTDDEEIATLFTIGLSAFINSFCYLTYFALMATTYGVLYFTLKETYTAENLISRIATIKSKE